MSVEITVQETTGRKATTLRALSLLTRFLMSFVVKLRAATASKDSKSLILLVVVLVLVWVPC